MIGFADPLVLLVVAPLLFLWWRLGKGPREVWGLRIVMVLVGAMVLASPFFRGHEEYRRIVMLIDHSHSCGKKALLQAEEYAGLIQENLAPGDRLTRVLFGKNATVLPGEGRLGELTGGGYADASDLSAGLTLARALLAGREGGRIFMVSDGLHTGPDPLEQIPALVKGGVAVDYVPVVRDEGRDIAITRVHVPERIQQGRPFEIAVTVHTPEPVEAMLSVRRKAETMEKPVKLEAGANHFVLTDTAGVPGLMRYTIHVRVDDDDRPENNRALAVTQSIGPSSVLVLNQGSQTDNLVRALETAGLKIVLGDPGAPLTSADLKSFAAVVLDNIPLSAMSDRADSALRNYVQNMGGGLLITGGRRSFAEGGYYQSHMEEILPVSLMSKEDYHRSKVAMCMVLDRSGSMSANVTAGVTKMDLANKAACEAIGVLLPGDEVAVFAVDSSPHRVVPLVPLNGNRDAITEKVLSIESMGGGIFVYVGLEQAVRELLESAAPTRHIALFADAADSEEPGGYRSLIGEWVRAGGTVSVIGLGTEMDVDAKLLKDIADRGGGTAFFTQDPEALPRLFCEDAIRVARMTFIEERTGASVSPEILRIGKLGIREFPDVLGYNLCYVKKEATQLVATTDENQAPLLAVWQSGLGRVAALCCEVDGPYTGELRNWSEYQPFHSSLVKWLERGRDDLSLFATIVRRGRTGVVKLELDEEAAGACTGAEALIIPPNEEDPLAIPLRWVSTQSMQGAFKLDSDGIYHGVVLTREGRRVGLPPVVLPYSPEFEPSPSSAGVEVLEKIAGATGGRRILHVRELLDAPTGRSMERTSAAPALGGVLLLLLLCDIITRKRLWGHLAPAFITRWLKTAASRAVSASGKVYKSIATRRKKEVVPKETDEKPAPPAPEPEESVFKQAKRRSRFDERDE